MPELEDFLNFARETAHEAGVLTLGYFARGVEIIEKSDGSPVTVADRSAEELIRQRIEARFPEHGIYGEEFDVKEPASGCSFQWYIDPIDATKSFIHGVPLYSTLCSLVRWDEPVVRIIEIPALGEQLSAAKGRGATLNGRQVRVSETSELARGVVLYTDFQSLRADAPSNNWVGLIEKCRFPRSWGDAYGHFLVATGRAEIMLDPIVNPYDVAPMSVIMPEAGGYFCDWKGKETFEGGNGVSCNAALRPYLNEHFFSD